MVEILVLILVEFKMRLIQLTIVLLLIISINSCSAPRLSNSGGDSGDVPSKENFDAGWSQNYYQLDFGSASKCEVVDSESLDHGIEIINNGDTPVNVLISTTNPVLTDPNSKWQFKAECKKINNLTGEVSGLIGKCWDGSSGIQDTYTDIPSSDTLAITCLRYDSTSEMKPGIRIDTKLDVSCAEPKGDKYGFLSIIVEPSLPSRDCDSCGDGFCDPLTESCSGCIEDCEGDLVVCGFGYTCMDHDVFGNNVPSCETNCDEGVSAACFSNYNSCESMGYIDNPSTDCEIPSQGNEICCEYSP